MAVDLAGPRARIVATYHEAVVLRDWTLQSETMQVFEFTAEVVSQHPVWSRARPLVVEVPIPVAQADTTALWRWTIPDTAVIGETSVRFTLTGMPERITVRGGSGLGPASPPAGEPKPWDRGSSSQSRSGSN